MNLRNQFYAVSALLICLSILRPVIASGATAPVAGGVAGGGGNTTIDKSGTEMLFDDFENQGTDKIPAAEIQSLAQAQLDHLALFLPGFAVKLRDGIKGITWYKESKPLNQQGECRNGSKSGIALTVQQVVRACQSNINVRIDKDWYDSKPPVLGSLIVHELLVYQRIHNNPHGLITEESILEVSREIRNTDPATMLTDLQLQDLVKRAGFGNFATKAQTERFMAARKRVLAYDKHNCHAGVSGENLLSESDMKIMFGPNLPEDLAQISSGFESDARKVCF
jgi:hypothetical protein